MNSIFSIALLFYWKDMKGEQESSFLRLIRCNARRRHQRLKKALAANSFIQRIGY